MVQPVNGVTLVCAWEPCGSSFTVFPSQVKKAKYCSRPCQWLATAAGRSKKVTLICAFPPCGKSFQTFAYKLQTDSPRCCSRTCKTSLIMMRKYPGTFEEKFWAQVAIAEPHECWPWQGRTGRGGYGMTYVPETQTDTGTHIVAFYFAHGRWPSPGMNVCHSCDNPPCCNEQHLWEGTDLENAQDSVLKGRKPRGERHWANTLTDIQWQEILALVAEGNLYIYEIAAQYNVHRSTIFKRLYQRS